MPKRSKPKSQKRDWRWFASLALNGAVALSMVLGTVLLFSGPPAPPPPTIAPPTQPAGSTGASIVPTPTPASAPAAPTPAPTSSALDSSPPDAVGALNFAVAGDARDGEVVFGRLLERVQNDGNAFLVLLGDLVTRGSTSNWLAFREQTKDFKLPIYAVPGNHELEGGSMAEFLRYSSAPASHYAFDRGAAHFTFLDSSAGGLNAAELAFLDDDLAKSAAPVKLVFVHHPPFDPAGGDHIMGEGRDQFMQIVARRRVHHVFAGHIHCYEEGGRDGVKYVITGGAGAPLSCLPVLGGFHHYVRVRLNGTTVTTEVVRID